MSFIAFAVFILLAAISGIHLAWATGVHWPRLSEADLVRTVIGHPGDKMPTPVQCGLAALAILIPGVIALMLAGLVRTQLPSWLVILAGAGAALIFAGRGIAGYLPAWRARLPREPFASLDRHYYSPLCLLLAAGFVVLIANEMRN